MWLNFQTAFTQKCGMCFKQVLHKYIFNSKNTGEGMLTTDGFDMHTKQTF